MLLDKGYFDYDYEKVERPAPAVDWESTIKSDEEVAEILSIFGVGQQKPQTDEEIQQYILNQGGK